MKTTTDPEGMIPLGHESNRNETDLSCRLALRRRSQLQQLSADLPPFHFKQPCYGWELLHYRIGALIPAHLLTEGFDFLPVQFPHSVQQFALYHNLFSVSGLWKHYDHVVVSLAPEILQKLSPIAKAHPVGQYAFFYRRSSTQESNSNLEVHFLESTAPEIIALKEVPPERLRAISTLTMPLAEQVKNEIENPRPQYPPENGFIPWLESLALLKETSSTTDCRPQLQLADLLPYIGSKTLFLCSVQNFQEILRLTHSKEFLEYVEFVLQNKEYAQLHRPLPFSGRRSVTLYKASAKSRLEFSATLPFHFAQFAEIEGAKTSASGAAYTASSLPFVFPNALLSFSLEKIFEEASLRYEDWTKIKIRRSSQDSLQLFLSKMLISEKKSSPNAFDLILAAKACTDGNFSAKIAETLENFATSPQLVSSELLALSELELRLSDVFQDTQVLQLQSFVTFEHIKSKGSRAKPRSQSSSKTSNHFKNFCKSDAQSNQTTKKMETELIEETKKKYTEQSWVESSSGYHCSFPDEDFFLDTSVYKLTRQARSRFLERSEKTIAAETSLEDGIDIRATVRHWHMGKLFVRSLENKKGHAFGAVVYNFTGEDDQERQYSWKALWTAEEHDATHLMFFATPFRDEIIGPGIARSTFGGFAALPAANRVYDLWNHPWLNQVSQSNAELLLLASAFCSSESSIIYVAQKMPRRAILEILRQNHKHIVFISMGTIDQNQIRKLRTFHVLAEPAVRLYAQSFIQKDSGN